MSKILFLPVETYTRSFDSRLRIAFHYAADRNYAIIGSKNKIKKLLFKLEGPINYLSKGEAQDQRSFDFLQSLQSTQSGIFLLDEEGGITDSEGTSLKFRYDEEKMSYFNRVYLWGEFSKKYVDNASGKYLVTGNPRFDSLVPKLTYVNPILPIVRHIDRYRKNILINTSFSMGNSILSSDKMIENRKDVLGDHFDREKDELHISYHHLVFQYFKKLARLTAEKHPDIGLIIRPHPSEDPAGYQPLTQHFPNVFIDSKRELNAVSLASLCDLVVHHDCTTGIEALIAETKVVAFLPIRSEHCQPLPIASTHNIESFDELLEVVDRLSREEKLEIHIPAGSMNRIRTNIYNFGREDDTAKVLADDLLARSQAYPSALSLEELKSKITGYALGQEKPFLEKVVSKTQQLVKSWSPPPVINNYAITKRGKVHYEDVQAKTEVLRRYFNTKVKVLELSREVYLLYQPH